VQASDDRDSDHRLRHDPRRDPTDPPPAPPASKEQATIEQGEAATQGAAEAAPDSRRGLVPAHVRDKGDPARPGMAHVVTIDDPRIPEIEAALTSSD